jgi:hypothetical protein
LQTILLCCRRTYWKKIYAINPEGDEEFFHDIWLDLQHVN